MAIKIVVLDFFRLVVKKKGPPEGGPLYLQRGRTYYYVEDLANSGTASFSAAASASL